jgi:hypothetical protein
MRSGNICFLKVSSTGSSFCLPVAIGLEYLPPAGPFTDLADTVEWSKAGRTQGSKFPSDVWLGNLREIQEQGSAYDKAENGTGCKEEGAVD